MFSIYFIYKNTPNLNISNKMLTHITILATIMTYVINNLAEIEENNNKELKKQKMINIKKKKEKKKKFKNIVK